MPLELDSYKKTKSLHLFSLLTLILGEYISILYSINISITLFYNNITIITYLDNTLNINLAIISATAIEYIINLLVLEGLCFDTVNLTINIPSGLFSAAAYL